MVRTVVVAVGLLAGGSALAEKAAVRTPVQARPAPAKAAPAKKRPVARVKAAVVTTPPAPTANAVMVHYQRIGRDLMQLQKQRGHVCTMEMMPIFKSIKLEEAMATPESRIEVAETLQDLQTQIERQKGIIVSKQCLDNPLAPDCL